MKFAIITDTHIGVRNDLPLFHDFYEKFYSNVFFPMLEVHGIKTVVMMGDTFDKRKAINFLGLDRSMQYLFDRLKSKEVYCLVGNHDAPLKNSIRVSSSKLLLSQYQNIRVIDTPTEVSIGGKNLLMLPWICDENYADSLEMIEKTDSTILCSHLELAGFEMHKGQLSDHGQIKPELLGKFSRVWSGHYHHRSSQGNIAYLGNPYELTWGDYDDPRGFHIYDTETDTLEVVDNPYRMFHKIFYDDTITQDIDFSVYAGTFVKVIVIKKTDFLAFDTFIHNLQSANPYDYKVIEDFSEFEESALSDEAYDYVPLENTLTLLTEYINGVTTELDKPKLTSMMQELYAESIDKE